MPTLDPSSFFFWNEPRILVDVRPVAAFLKGSFESAESIPQDQYSTDEELSKEIEALKADRPLHLIDVDGNVAETLTKHLPTTYLQGGYNGFKIWRDLAFHSGPTVCLLGGYSGSGKTQFLEHLHKHGHQVIDLESLAAHKGSVFGSSDSQPLHDTFQNKLLRLWHALENDTVVWIEEKGPFLGQVGIPSSLYQKMLSAPMIHLDVPFEQRLKNILQEYKFSDDDKFRTSLKGLEQRMGTSQNQKALHFHDTGQKEKCFELLLRYYDRAYEKRREKYWSGKLIHLEYADDDIPGALEKIALALRTSA